MPYKLFKDKKPNVSNFKAFERSASSTIMVRKTLVNLVQGVMKVYLLAIPLLVRHIMFINKCTKVIEESTHVFSLMKIMMILLAHLQLINFSCKYVDDEDEGVMDGCNHQCASSNVDQSLNQGDQS